MRMTTKRSRRPWTPRSTKPSGFCKTTSRCCRERNCSAPSNGATQSTYSAMKSPIPLLFAALLLADIANAQYSQSKQRARDVSAKVTQQQNATVAEGAPPAAPPASSVYSRYGIKPGQTPGAPPPGAPPAEQPPTGPAPPIKATAQQQA